MSNPMNLNLPVPTQTLGPDWAEQLNEQLEENVAGHDHSEGKGVPVPSAGLNINDELPFNNNSASLVKSVRFVDQDGVLSELVDVSSIYSVQGDLYYNNEDGTPVQITSGGALAATSLGGWTGLPSGTASAGFSIDTFTLLKATNQYGNLRIGQISLFDGSVINPPYSVNLKAPSGLLASHDITLPSAPPASKSFITMSATGVLAPDVAVAGGIIESMIASDAVSTSKIQNGAINAAKLATDSVETAKVKDANITTAKVANQAITRAKLEPVGQDYDSSVGGSTTSSSYTTELSVSVVVTTISRPIVISFQGRLSAVPKMVASGNGNFRVQMTAGPEGTGTISSVAISSGNEPYLPTLNCIYTPGTAGTYTFALQYNATAGTTQISDPAMYAYQL